MRYLCELICVLALGVMPVVGCDGTAAIECENNICPCNEAGIRDAIAAGGGPYTFDCDGPQTVVTEAEIVIDSDVILDGEGNLTIDGGADHRVLQVAAWDATVELRGFSITGGSSEGSGGGILNRGKATITDSAVFGNTSRRGGGGIHTTHEMTVLNSMVFANTSRNEDGFDWFDGGGIENFRGTLIVTNSSVWGNQAVRGADGIANISFEGGYATSALTDSTVSANEGGAIHNEGGAITLMNSTASGIISNNGFTAGEARLTLRNSTISGAVHGTGGFFESPELYGGVFVTTASTLIDGECRQWDEFVEWTSNGYNIESPGNTCGFDQPTDQVNVTADDLKLGPLQDNGGPTETHALLPGSVAIDVIAADMCEVDEDQRGFPRDSMCDVGAFELQP